MTQQNETDELEERQRIRFPPPPLETVTISGTAAVSVPAAVPKPKRVRRPNGPWQERLWKRVARGDADDCWPFTGGSYRKGYGHFYIGKQGVGAHRAAWAAANGGELPPRALEVLHACDNPPCCNPAHLSLGTRKQNTADMFSKGRSSVQRRGTSNRLGTGKRAVS